MTIYALSPALRGLGYTVLEASDGIDAASVVKKHSGEAIHLLLADMVMPKMGGTALARQLRDIYPDIRVVFMSGYIDVELDLTGPQGDSAFLLQKPFTRSVLSRKVREVLDK